MEAYSSLLYRTGLNSCFLTPLKMFQSQIISLVIWQETHNLFPELNFQVAGTTRLFLEEYQVPTKEKEYLNKLHIAFLWFLGENDLRISLYDEETHGCCDGIENSGVNRNQGAESTISYLISHLTMLKVNKLLSN